jgi:hypothetical protein
MRLLDPEDLRRSRCGTPRRRRVPKNLRGTWASSPKFLALPYCARCGRLLRPLLAEVLFPGQVLPELVQVLLSPFEGLLQPGWQVCRKPDDSAATCL